MDPDQTDLGSHCLSLRLQNFLVDNIQFVIMLFKG